MHTSDRIVINTACSRHWKIMKNTHRTWYWSPKFIQANYNNTCNYHQNFKGEPNNNVNATNHLITSASTFFQANDYIKIFNLSTNFFITAMLQNSSALSRNVNDTRRFSSVDSVRKWQSNPQIYILQCVEFWALFQHWNTEENGALFWYILRFFKT